MTDSSAGSARRHSWRVGRFVCVLAAAMGLMAVVPAVASAAEIHTVLLRPSCTRSTPSGCPSLGGTSLTGTSLPPSGPPGATAYGTRISVGTSAGVRSVVYSFNNTFPTNNRTCVTLPGSATSADFTVTSNLVLPSTTGSHPLYLRVGTANCSSGYPGGTVSSTFTFHSVTVTPPTPVAANRSLPLRCGLRTLLVLDESNSIHTEGAVGLVRDAARAFVKAFRGKDSPLAITAFGDRARNGVVPYQAVTDSNVSTFESWIDGHTVDGHRGYFGEPRPVEATNWQDALEHIHNVPGGPPELVVFVTDGSPTLYNAGAAEDLRGAGGTGTQFDQIGLDRAIAAANGVKSEHTHMFVVGVGPDVGVAGSEAARRLQDISGPSEFPANPDFSTADYMLARRFDELEASLASIVSSLCGSSLTITKFVPGPGGRNVEAPGWHFTTTLSGDHTWLAPNADAGTGPTASLVTSGSNGSINARFNWTVPADHPSLTAHVVETEQAGYRFVRATCEVHHDGAVIHTETSTTRIPDVPLAAGEFGTCQVVNTSSPVDVFTAYVDGYRPGLATPDPWEGSPNSVFEGCNYFSPDACPQFDGNDIYDGGAIRIENPSTTAVTVTDASVAIGEPPPEAACVYRPWPGLHVVVAPGHSLILTQTGGPSPCPNDGVVGDYNFDTSESNHSLTPCTNDGEIPTIHLTTSAGDFTFHDVSQILNTGGEDPGNALCGSRNESHDTWEPAP